MLNRRQTLIALPAGLAAAFRPVAATASASPTLLVTHPASLRHDPGVGHPDRPARLAALLDRLGEEPFRSLLWAKAPLAARSALLRVHGAAHLDRLIAAAPDSGVTRLSEDVIMNKDSLEAATRAAGGATSAIDAIMAGQAKNAFVAVRPPGHHATASAAQGFCLMNNAAIAARHAQAAHGAERVAIVDFDVHHGNGLQEIFWSDKNVLYCSTHQMPLYPGTGASSESGAHDNIVNAPLRKGDSGEAFREALKTKIFPRLGAFAPDVLILCAGFDAHIHDPLGGLRLTADNFRDVTLRAMDIAARRCNGRIVSILEGGYRPDDLANSVAMHVGALLGA
jgi:acetoin utilization deacetylase AcuC-like enzyme